ncbi:hypothetical protein [Roseateles terrae]|uniref:Uncharacterized protein n=1 Tax=Roseateles terrae TaxID=431060 RepID=A0ABR6GSU0_9BURK|nr:hypothetical protein [Roseateles terrae]MBB3194791.1 hypothetical protein [Roseateles terrae]OWQ85937.1 hypothetical protein CDN98_14590 [Roseateles terrae]
MAYICSFEVIAQPLAPGVPNVPFVQQGTFLQITNVGGADTTVSVYYYVATPNFVVQSSDQSISLFANYIDASGNINQVAASQFIEQYNGFVGVPISQGQTVIFGVQYIFTPPSDMSKVEMVGGTPQSSAQARGSIQIFPTTSASTQLFCNATVRQVFNNYDSNGNLLDVDESAYALPIQGGPIVMLSSDDARLGPKS